MAAGDAGPARRCAQAHAATSRLPSPPSAFSYFPALAPQEHESATEANRRADTLQGQADSVRADPAATLRHLRETAALAQLPAPRLADLKASAHSAAADPASLLLTPPLPPAAVTSQAPRMCPPTLHPQEELDKARVTVADVQAKRAAEALKPLDCVVCLDVALQRIAFGCGHAVCTRCAPRLARCPTCSAPVKTRMMLYL